MRAYVLEHEVHLGTRELAFTRGTPHSMRHSFAQVEAADVIALRHSPAGWMLRRTAGWFLPRYNFLVQALRSRELEWVE